MVVTEATKGRDLEEQTAIESYFSGWQQYPDQFSERNLFCYNTAQLRHNLDQQASRLFSDETEINVIDAAEREKFKTDVKSFHSAKEVEEHFSQELADLRIISIVRKHSLKPLKISKEVILKILQRHRIGPCFLDLLFSFRNVEELSEKGHSLWSTTESSVGTSELCYQFKYMERNDHSQGVQWSERQIGVYHRFGTTGKDVMILLHAGLNTEVQRRLRGVFSEGQYTKPRSSSPMLLHTLIIGTYLDNWRWVLDDYGNECLGKESKGFTVSLHHQSLNFLELQSLRNLQSKLLVASTVLEATRNVIEGLEITTKNLALNVANKKSNMNDQDLAGVPEIQALQILKLKCIGYIASLQTLQNRAEKLTKLLADALNLKSQDATIKIADSTFELTQQSVEDNAIVRVITVITLIYLPTQGVATFFGMNLTQLSEVSNRIAFANDWWLFVAISVPLTILTLAILGIASGIERSKKLKRQREKSLTAG